MAIMSAAKATGWAWKLPPEIARPRPERRSGCRSPRRPRWSACARLLEQVERGAHHLRLAAEAVGVLDLAAASHGCEDLAAVEQPGSRRRRGSVRAGRAARETRGSNGFAAALERIDRQRSAAIAAANTRSPENNASSASAVYICVPLISARPSLGPSWSGSMPSRRAPRGGMTSPATSMRPWPISAAVICASGARSPQAPTLPCAGMTGIASRSSRPAAPR